MARVTLPMGMRSISGKVGNVCFRTMKATGRIYVSSMPCVRKHALSEAERATRERFARKARLVKAMRQAGSKLTQKQLWKLAEQAL